METRQPNECESYTYFIHVFFSIKMNIWNYLRNRYIRRKMLIVSMRLCEKISNDFNCGKLNVTTCCLAWVCLMVVFLWLKAVDTNTSSQDPLVGFVKWPLCCRWIWPIYHSSKCGTHNGQPAMTSPCVKWLQPICILKKKSRE